MHMARGNAKYAFWSVQQELKELFFLGNFLTRGKWHCRAANISRRLTGWDCHISSWKQKKNAMLAVKEKDLCRGETFINTEKKRLYILRLSFCISSVAITGQKALRDSNLIHPFSVRVNEFSNHHPPFLSYLVQIITREFHCCLNLSSFSMICALTKCFWAHCFTRSQRPSQGIKMRNYFAPSFCWSPGEVQILKRWLRS